jgi:hypothetical protein
MNDLVIQNKFFLLFHADKVPAPDYTNFVKPVGNMAAWDAPAAPVKSPSAAEISFISSGTVSPRTRIKEEFGSTSSSVLYPQD